MGKKVEKREKIEKKSRVWGVFRGILVILQLIASVFLMVSLIRMNVLQEWQNAVVGVVLFVILLFCAWLLWRKKTFARVIGGMLAAFVAAACIFCFGVSGADDCVY